MTLPISRAMLGWFITGCHDNGGATVDRYTIEMRDGDLLCLSANPTHPLGVSQWGEGGIEPNIELTALPEHIQSHILFRLNEAFEDFIDDGIEQDRSYREVMRDVVCYARNGQVLDAPADFDALVSANNPGFDRFKLEEAGQLPFSAIVSGFDLSPEDSCAS